MGTQLCLRMPTLLRACVVGLPYKSWPMTLMPCCHGRWGMDDLFRGSYSYLNASAGEHAGSAVDLLAEPLRSRAGAPTLWSPTMMGDGGEAET